MKEFGFSEGFIKKTNRILLIAMLSGLPFAFVYGEIITGGSISAALRGVAYTYLVLGAIWAIEIPLIRRIQRKRKVIIEDERIVRRCGKRERNISWRDIAKIKIVETAPGGIHTIKLYERNKKAIRLYGFNQMETIADLVKEKVSDNVSIRTKRQRLDWDNPFMVIMYVWACALVIFPILVIAEKYLDDFIRSLLR